MYVVSSQGYGRYRCAGRSRGLECLGLKITAPLLEQLVVAVYLQTFGAHPAFTVVEHRGAPEVSQPKSTRSPSR